MADQRKVYASEAAAYRRVALLQRAGYWPGVVPAPGGWRLTIDPDDAPRPHRAAEDARA